MFGKRLDAFLARHHVELPEGARREWLQLMRHLVQEEAEASKRQGFKLDPSMYKPNRTQLLQGLEPVNIAPHRATLTTPDTSDGANYPSQPTIIEASTGPTGRSSRSGQEHAELKLLSHPETLDRQAYESLLPGHNPDNFPTNNQRQHQHQHQTMGFAEAEEHYDPRYTPDPLSTSADDGLSSRYEDLGLIAQGGMGEVRRVKDRELNRVMAMKVLRRKWLDHPEVMLRFMEEAQATSQLQHPGVAPVHELGYLPDGRLYFTMKEIRGETMGARIRKFHRARLSGKQTKAALDGAFVDLLEAFCLVCKTVAWAHSRGVIHRDLKPENVMLGDLGEVLVVDWGLARIKDRKDDFAELFPAQDGIHTHRTRAEAAWDTHMGEVIGTPAYMPPEQAQGEQDKLGPPADIYALGAILYEILSGRPPYEAESFAKILYQVLSGPPPTPVPCPVDAPVERHETAHSAPPTPFVVPVTPTAARIDSLEIPEAPTQGLETPPNKPRSPRHTPVAPMMVKQPGEAQSTLPTSTESLTAAPAATNSTSGWQPPTPLVSVCMHAMARTPEERHPEVGSLRTAIRSWLAHKKTAHTLHARLERAQECLTAFGSLSLSDNAQRHEAEHLESEALQLLQGILLFEPTHEEARAGLLAHVREQRARVERVPQEEAHPNDEFARLRYDRILRTCEVPPNTAPNTAPNTMSHTAPHTPPPPSSQHGSCPVLPSSDALPTKKPTHVDTTKS